MVEFYNHPDQNINWLLENIGNRSIITWPGTNTLKQLSGTEDGNPNIWHFDETGHLIKKEHITGRRGSRSATRVLTYDHKGTLSDWKDPSAPHFSNRSKAQSTTILKTGYTQPDPSPELYAYHQQRREELGQTNIYTRGVTPPRPTRYGPMANIDLTQLGEGVYNADTGIFTPTGDIIQASEIVQSAVDTSYLLKNVMPSASIVSRAMQAVAPTVVPRKNLWTPVPTPTYPKAKLTYNDPKPEEADGSLNNSSAQWLKDLAKYAGTTVGYLVAGPAMSLNKWIKEYELATGRNLPGGYTDQTIQQLRAEQDLKIQQTRAESEKLRQQTDETAPQKTTIAGTIGDVVDKLKGPAIFALVAFAGLELLKRR